MWWNFQKINVTLHNKVLCMADDNVFTGKPRKGGKEIRIARVSEMMHNDISNVAKHVGISVTDLLKAELLHIISKYPDHYRKPMLDA